MFKEWTLAGLMALNLSYAPVEGLTQNEDIHYDSRLVDNNPFSGARSIDIDLSREAFDTPKPPIPYIEYWGNDIGQTAQQMIAICFLLETEADLSCDLAFIDYFRKE